VFGTAPGLGLGLVCAKAALAATMVAIVIAEIVIAEIRLIPVSSAISPRTDQPMVPRPVPGISPLRTTENLVQILDICIEQRSTSR
jgi:hypothetical protein